VPWGAATAPRPPRLLLRTALEDSEPTMPTSQSTGATDTPSVWLVSFSETDDRELSRSEIAMALSRGEITPDTIVWTDGMRDWLPISQVPALAALLPTGGDTLETGGFLGTGLILSAQAAAAGTDSADPSAPETEAPRPEAPGEAAPASRSDRKSVKPPLPAKRSSRPPPPPEGDEPEPISLLPESAPLSAEAPIPGPPLGDAPVTPKPPRPPAVQITDAGPSASAEEDMEPAPSSGTPALTSLASLPPKPARTIDDELLALGSQVPDLMAPPTIDISNLTSDASVETTRERPTTPPASAEAAPGRRQAAPERKSGSALPWVVAICAVGVTAWALLGRQAPAVAPASLPPAPTVVPTPEPAASPPPAPEALAAVSASAPAEPPPEPPAAAPSAPTPLSAVPAAVPQSATTRSAATAPAAPTVTASPAPTPAATASAAPAAAPPTAAPAATTEAPVAPAEDMVVAGPFDKAAAATALQTQAEIASSCRKEGDPAGRALVTVSFANSGRAVRATVDGPPFAGTATGGCIASTMRAAQVPPFSGDRVTVSKTVIIN
jgi:hypothetical protein